MSRKKQTKKGGKEIPVAAIAAKDLRWDCPHQRLKFKSTADIDPIAGVIGQPLALEALRFGLDCDVPGQNVFVRGLRGTGRVFWTPHLFNPR